ncbi:PC-esterase domain-containing protein 1A [Aulostomus maculatus]
MKCVSHQQLSKLFHNKFIVVVGDSIQRSVYKDLVLLLQKEKYLSFKQLKSKGEMSFEQDCLIEGGCLNRMHNGTEYREVRQYQSAHHLVRFYFVTRIYSPYMRSILNDFRHSLKPDLVIVNSCVWDISRYDSRWVHTYKENLLSFFDELRDVLPEDSLVIWNLTMPLGERIRGGFLVPEIEHKAAQLRYDVVEANFYSGTLADCYKMDVLDLHFHFRFSLQHRTRDGVHWNALAHRRITTLLSQHAAQAWGVILPLNTSLWEPSSSSRRQPVRSLPDVLVRHQTTFLSCDGLAGSTGTCQVAPPPANFFSNMDENLLSRPYCNRDFCSDSVPSSFLSFENQSPTFQPSTAGALRLQDRHGFHYRPPQNSRPYKPLQLLMRSRHTRQHHYTPYTHPRSSHHSRYGPHY